MAFERPQWITKNGKRIMVGGPEDKAGMARGSARSAAVKNARSSKGPENLGGKVLDYGSGSLRAEEVTSAMEKLNIPVEKVRTETQYAGNRAEGEYEGVTSFQTPGSPSSVIGKLKEGGFKNVNQLKDGGRVTFEFYEKEGEIGVGIDPRSFDKVATSLHPYDASRFSAKEKSMDTSYAPKRAR
jgi:hypothetical protein